MGKTCVICGAPSGMYPLCIKHLKEKADGKVIKCTECNTWHEVDKPCRCQKTEPATHEKNEVATTTTEEENKIITINEKNKSKCITCGRSTDGLLFCGGCYQKYKNKELLFKITECSNVELLDADYESKITCKDGHIVKSKSEYMIDDYLYSHGIIHAYEKTLPYGPNPKDILEPDFYLPNYLGQGKHVYIEHWGYNENNIKYTKTKKFKLPIYEKLGITLICTHETIDTNDIEAALDRKLNKSFIKENKINFEEK